MKSGSKVIVLITVLLITSFIAGFFTHLKLHSNTVDYMTADAYGLILRRDVANARATFNENRTVPSRAAVNDMYELANIMGTYMVNLDRRSTENVGHALKEMDELFYLLGGEGVVVDIRGSGLSFLIEEKFFPKSAYLLTDGEVAE